MKAYCCFLPDNIVVSYGWLRQRIKVEGCGTVPKILLVEDNQAAVVKIRQFIENIDTALELLTCKEAGAAYILAQKQKVDLFILDIQLKDYKGTSLAAQLRGLPEYKYTPIIFESALAGEELSAYREVKCYGFLIKPYTEAEFRAVLCDALGLSAHLHQKEKHIQIEQKQFILDYLICGGAWEKTYHPYPKCSFRNEGRCYFGLYTDSLFTADR